MAKVFPADRRDLVQLQRWSEKEITVEVKIKKNVDRQRAIDKFMTELRKRYSFRNSNYSSRAK